MFGFITAFAENAADGVSVAGKAAAGAAASGAADSGAAASGAGGVIGMIGTMLPMILLVVVLYFIMIRPQRKKEKELKAQIDAMRVGDKVVTIGGICGCWRRWSWGMRSRSRRRTAACTAMLLRRSMWRTI